MAADEEPTGLGPPPRLDCARCGRAMDLGLAAIAATAWDFLHRDLSAQRLWFQPDGGGEHLDLLDHRRSVAAQHCGRCGTLVLFTRP